MRILNLFFLLIKHANERGKNQPKQVLFSYKIWAKKTQYQKKHCSEKGTFHKKQIRLLLNND